MKNYYELLLVPESASFDEIKQAYRKLAIKYHPDKNPGNPHAEELFKQINEAYDTLSNPVKKSHYDAALSYERFQVFTPPPQTHTYQKTYNYRQTYTNPESHQYQQAEPRMHYRIGSWLNLSNKQFMVVLALCTTVVFGIIGLANYVQIEEQESRKREAKAKLEYYYQVSMEVEAHFEEGNYAKSLNTANKLVESLREYGIAESFQDDIQSRIKSKGIEHIEAKDYSKAVDAFEALLNYGDMIYQTAPTFYFLGLSYYHSGKDALAYELLSGYENEEYPEIPTLLAIICRDKKQNIEEAITWHNKAKKILSEIYSNIGFQFVPTDAPDTHFEAYYQSAQTSFSINDTYVALQDLRGALFLRSNNKDALYMKGLCERELGLGDACLSFEKAKKQGHPLAEAALKKCPQN